MLRKALATFGEYLIFLRQVFSKPAKWSVFLKKWVFEMDAMGIGSMLIVSIVSLAFRGPHLHRDGTLSDDYQSAVGG